MKKIFDNAKKCVSLFVLVLLVMCTISSVTQASFSKVGNRQYNSSKGYRSHTEISGFYDDRGYAYNVFAMAVMSGDDDNMKIVYGSAKATANSPYIRSKKNAYHGYAIGGTVMDVWMKN